MLTGLIGKTLFTIEQLNIHLRSSMFQAFLPHHHLDMARVARPMIKCNHRYLLPWFHGVYQTGKLFHALNGLSIDFQDYISYLKADLP
jgi:hypothetical protein